MNSKTTNAAKIKITQKDIQNIRDAAKAFGERMRKEYPGYTPGKR